MIMNRRQLLARLLGGSAALAAADIWIPGDRTIFLPPTQCAYQGVVVTSTLLEYIRIIGREPPLDFQKATPPSDWLNLTVPCSGLFKGRSHWDT